MRLQALAPFVIAIGLIAGAKQMGAEARAQRDRWPKDVDEPFAPSPDAALYVSLGYREAVADVIWIRALAYVGGGEATSAGVRHHVAALVALDPRNEEVFNWSALAMQGLEMQLTNADYLAMLAIIERGMKEFPDNWRLPLRAGEIYARGLKSDDPAQQRAWKEQGARLISKAVRLPGARTNIGTYVAHLETELGHREQAIRDLRELIGYTSNPRDRDRLVKKLAALTRSSSDAIDYELAVERQRFESAWKAARPELPPSMYVVLGPPLAPAFDLADLADDPEQLVEPIEPLPPLPDDANGEAPAPTPGP